MLSLDGLPNEVHDTLDAFVTQVTETFGDIVEGIILYGSAVRGDFLPGRSNLNILLLLTSSQPDVLQRYAKLHRRWSKEQIVVPLFVTEQELQATASVFPLEYLEMQAHHRLLVGHDPLVGLKIDLRHLAIQVEQGLHGNLIRLRQRYVEGGSGTEAAAILLPLSVTSLLPCLRGIQRLLGHPLTQPSDAVIKELETTLDADLTGLHDALQLKRGLITPGPAEVPRLFQRHVASLESLIERFAEFKRQGRI